MAAPRLVHALVMRLPLVVWRRYAANEKALTVLFDRTPPPFGVRGEDLCATATDVVIELVRTSQSNTKTVRPQLLNKAGRTRCRLAVL